MGTALQLAATPEQITDMEAVVKECNLTVLETHGNFQRTFMLAAGMKRIGELITDPMMQDIMHLQNSGLGFKTDKAKGPGYPVEDVRRVTIEATLRGLHMIGNEVNIISGGMYATKNGLRRLVLEWPGLSEFTEELDIPQNKTGGALVGCKATWKLNGNPQSLERRGDQAIPVRVNAGMGADAILGKAKRKLYAAVYDRLTGLKQTIPEGEVDEPINVTAEPEKRARPSTLGKPLGKPGEQEDLFPDSAP